MISSSLEKAKGPPLPLPIQDSGPAVPRDDAQLGTKPSAACSVRRLREGCHLLHYRPRTSSLSDPGFEGTLRVERDGNNNLASGDLYQQELTMVQIPSAAPGQAPGDRERRRGDSPVDPVFALASLGQSRPAAGIPVFARSRYAFYLRVTGISEESPSGALVLRFEGHRYDVGANAFVNEGAFAARLVQKPAPSGFPCSAEYFEGDVFDGNEQMVGYLTVGWLSKYLRKATFELDRVAHSESPVGNGLGLDFAGVFDEVGWQVSVQESELDVAELTGESWSDAECHACMLTRRDASNLDVEWRYHLLSVRRLDSTERGIMYDALASDSNQVPREGAAIASHWIIPNEAQWGRVRGQRFGEATAPYFRTAVHELGHAQGLLHNERDNGFMNTTGNIIASLGTFPDNIQWRHAPDDQHHLRHMPDVWVRPGGAPFGSGYEAAPAGMDVRTPERLAGLRLSVSPVLEMVPLGAPVRVNFRVENVGPGPLPVPHSLSMKAGYVSGVVVDPAGNRRSFRPLVLCMDDERTRVLQPGEGLWHSMTLLRGRQGALFPIPGGHRIRVHVTYAVGRLPVEVVGETEVVIAAARDDEHERAAARTLGCPNLLLTLVMGGDGLSDGVEALRTALQNRTLAAHFRLVEARRVGRHFFARRADLAKATEHIAAECVMSPAEVRRAAELVRLGPDSQAKNGALDNIKRCLDRDGVQASLRQQVLDQL